MIEINDIIRKDIEKFLKGTKDNHSVEDFIRDVKRLGIFFPSDYSIDFYKYFQDKIDWDSFSMSFLHTNIMYTDLIREFPDKVDWEFISKNEHLSEDFIREFQDKVNWRLISKYTRTLSDDFIKEFQDKLDWDYAKPTKYYLKKILEILEKKKELN